MSAEEEERLFPRERERVKPNRSNFFQYRAFCVATVIAAVLIFSNSASAQAQTTSSSNNHSFFSYTLASSASKLASVGSFFRSLIFSAPSTDKSSPSSSADKSTENSSFQQTEDDQSASSADESDQNSNLAQTLDDTIALVKSLEAKYNKLQKELANLQASGLKVEGQPANNIIIERTVEKVTSGLSQTDLNSGLSSLRTELDGLNTKLTNQIANLSSQTSLQNTATYQAISLSNKIDSLSNTALSNPTVTGTLTNQTLSNSGNATIGGTLTVTGATTLASLTASTISLASLSVTSTTATSTFSTGGLTVGTNQFVIQQTSGNVGIGTTSPVSSFHLAKSGAAILTVENYGDNNSAGINIVERSGDIRLRIMNDSSGNYIESGDANNTGNKPLYITGYYSTTGSNLFIDMATTSMTGRLGIGTTSPNWKLSVAGIGSFDDNVRSSYFTATSTTATSTFAGFIDVLGTGSNATSTISGNLWVKNTLRAATSYVGDLIFGNGFKFTEADPILTGSNALYLQNQFGSTTLAIGENGNIGIGTTSPAYKLQVMGDIAATSFVNISTRDAKKDISYLTSSQETDFLNKIKTTSIANYHYNVENQANPLRLGLIAEEAPAEILSVDGKGVDVYKIATFTLGGVKSLSAKVEDLKKEIEKMKIDITALSAGGISGGSGAISGSDSLFAWITEKFKAALGITFENEKVKVKNLCVGETCVTEEQFKAVFGSSQSASSSSAVSSSPESSSSSSSSLASSSSESVNSSESSSSSSLSSQSDSSGSSSEAVSSSESSSSIESSSSSESSL